MARRILCCAALVVLLAASSPAARAQETRATIMAPAGTVVLRVHAVGAQIYECKANAAGTLLWTLREPIAALMSDGKTIGRHFVGPSWDMADGSRIVGTVVAKAPGASPGDVPWLRLDGSGRRGNGVLDGVTTIQRINTVGGNRTGNCAVTGDYAAEPYSADYIFSRP